MNLDLTPSEARFLLEHLTRHLAHVDDELIHTDKRQMQRALAQDLHQLEVIRERLAIAVDGATYVPPL